MDDLARRLRISKRTLYEHFSSKVDILSAIMDQTFAEMNNITEQIIQDEKLSLNVKIKGVMNVLPKHWEFYDLRNAGANEAAFPRTVSQSGSQWLCAECGPCTRLELVSLQRRCANNLNQVTIHTACYAQPT